MDELEYIDAYFKGELPPEESARFDQRIREDKAFAESVAFYLAADRVIKEQASEEKRRTFRRLYDGYRTDSGPRTPRRARRYLLLPAIAALFAGLVISLFLLLKPPSPAQLADKYVRDHFTTLGVTLSSRADSLQDGLRLYNEGRFNNALAQFKTIFRTDSTNTEAIKYDGIVSLRLQDYDKALTYFRLLGTHTGLYANPAKFYEAITLLKRNHPGDPAAARLLLQDVVRSSLEGKDQAQEWLKWF